MNPEFDEVLLTAYLDEEVTDAERTAVEEQLRASESSRKLLEELRSVRSLVMQLHQTQPSRSFQSGPWKEAALANESPKVVLNHSGATWGMSYQKLATIAALIAVAVCSSLLFLQPNGTSISRSGDTGSAKRIELQAKNELEPNDQPLPSNAGEVAAVASFDSSGFERGSVDARRSDPGAFGAASAAPRPISPMAEPGVESKPEPLNPLVQTLLKSFFEVSSGKQNEWLVLESLGERDESNSFKDKSAEVDQTLSLGRTLAMDSKAQYSFRYKKTIERESVADEKKLQLESRPSENLTRTELDAKEAPPPLPIQIELQISSEDWGDGAKRLRELGIDVPVELPLVDFIDFTATSLPASIDIVDPSNKPGTPLQELSLWRFRRADAREGMVESEFSTQPRAQLFARIRVRVIKK